MHLPPFRVAGPGRSPLQPEDFGAQGIADVRESVERVQAGPNPGLRLAGYLITMISVRRAVHKLYETRLRQLYGDAVFAVMIPESVDFVEAIAQRKTVSQYKPRGAASKTIRTLADELAARLVVASPREDLKPVEQARAYKRLMDAHGWASRQLAAELNISQAAVVKALALLDLPARVQEAVEQGALAPSVAYEVARLGTPEAQAAMAEVATAEKLTRDEVALAVRAVKANRPTPQARPDPVTIDLEVAIVTVKWKKGSEGQTLSQLLRKALKTVQNRERDDQAA